MVYSFFWYVFILLQRSQEVTIPQSKKEETFLFPQEKVKEPQAIQKPLQVSLFHSLSPLHLLLPSPPLSIVPGEEVTSPGPAPSLSLHLVPSVDL